MASLPLCLDCECMACCAVIDGPCWRAGRAGRRGGRRRSLGRRRRRGLCRVCHARRLDPDARDERVGPAAGPVSISAGAFGIGFGWTPSNSCRALALKPRVAVSGAARRRDAGPASAAARRGPGSRHPLCPGDNAARAGPQARRCRRRGCGARRSRRHRPPWQEQTRRGLRQTGAHPGGVGRPARGTDSRRCRGGAREQARSERIGQGPQGARAARSKAGGGAQASCRIEEGGLVGLTPFLGREHPGSHLVSARDARHLARPRGGATLPTTREDLL